MKIKLPEKRFFTIEELAVRWECLPSDIKHLIETDELDWSIRLAAIKGKRSVFFGKHIFQYDSSRPCFEPIPPEEKLEEWKQIARDDELIIDMPIPFDCPIEEVTAPEITEKFEVILKNYKLSNPESFEVVLLLQDVLSFEAKYIQAENSEKPSRRQMVKSYVDQAFSSGKTKESAFKELAESEQCSVENIKRIYRDKDKYR